MAASLNRTERLIEEQGKWQFRPPDLMFRTVAHPPGDEGEVYRIEEPLPGGFFSTAARAGEFIAPGLASPHRHT